MDATRIVRLLVLLSAGGLLGCGLTGVDGGRGSGGFDFRENAIIDKVLSTQVCVNGQRLVFCPADQRSVATSTPTPIATAPTPTPPTGADRDAGDARRHAGRRRRVDRLHPQHAERSVRADVQLRRRRGSRPARRSASRRACASRTAPGRWRRRRPSTPPSTRRCSIRSCACNCRPARRRRSSSRCSSSSRRRRRSPTHFESLGAERHRLRVRHRRVRARGHHHRPAAHRDGDGGVADGDRHAGRADADGDPRRCRSPVRSSPTSAWRAPTAIRSLRAHSIRWAARSTSGRSASRCR